MSNYTWASKSRTFFEDYSGRVDQQFNASLKMYGSYTYNHQSGLGRPTSIAIPVFDGANGIFTPFVQQNASAGATKLLGPSMLNDFRVGFYRIRNDTTVPSYNQKLGGPVGDSERQPATDALIQFDGGIWYGNRSGVEYDVRIDRARSFAANSRDSVFARRFQQSTFDACVENGI